MMRALALAALLALTAPAAAAPIIHGTVSGDRVVAQCRLLDGTDLGGAHHRHGPRAPLPRLRAPRLREHHAQQKLAPPRLLRDTRWTLTK